MHHRQPARLTLTLALAWALLLPAALAQPASAPASAAAAAPAPAEAQLFAIEIKVGPGWDSSKPPQAQAGFREHSANLRRLREAGVLVMGARYADKGLVVVSAASAAEARAMMDADPSIAAGTFVFEVHPFNVFYAGDVKARSRR